MKPIKFINFAKGFSILGIIFMHYMNDFSWDPFFRNLFLFGGSGVHLFIFLSGFGLGLNPSMSPRRFYARRFIKILLPYYFVLSVIYLINQICKIYPYDLYAFLGHIFLYKMFDERIVGSFGYHFWFLSTIIQLYFIFPFLCYLREIHLNLLLIVSFTLSFFWWLFIYSQHLYELRIWNSFALQYLWEFALGMALSDVYKRKGLLIPAINRHIFLLIALLAMGIMYISVSYLGAIGKILNDIPALIAISSLCIWVYIMGKRKAIILTNIIEFVGNISFPLYLVHIFAKDFLNKSIVFLHLQGACTLTIYPFAFSISIILLSLLLNRFFRQVKVPIIKS